MLYSLQITTASAVSTLHICIRQSIKDSRKVAQVLGAIAHHSYTIGMYAIAIIYVLSKMAYSKLEQLDKHCQSPTTEATTEAIVEAVEHIDELIAIAPSVAPIPVPADRNQLKAIAQLYSINGFKKMPTARLKRAVLGAIAA